VGGRKSANSRFFSYALGAFDFFALFFLRAFALVFCLSARERESAKKAPAPTSDNQTVHIYLSSREISLTTKGSRGMQNNNISTTKNRLQCLQLKEPLNLALYNRF
jgi:hypothetical protein